MTITIREVPCIDGNVALDVQQNGMDIIVKSGSFRVRGIDFQVAEDITYTASSNQTYVVRAMGYMARSKEDDSIDLVVDEIVMDGFTKNSRWDNTRYELLCPLFWANIPISAVTLDDATIIVRHQKVVNERS